MIIHTNSEPETSSAFLKRARKDAKLTQQQFADRVGVSRTAVSLWELPADRGGNKPSYKHLKNIARALGLSYSYVAQCIIEHEPDTQQHGPVRAAKGASAPDELVEFDNSEGPYLEPPMFLRRVVDAEEVAEVTEANTAYNARKDSILDKLKALKARRALKHPDDDPRHYVYFTSNRGFNLAQRLAAFEEACVLDDDSETGDHAYSLIDDVFSDIERAIAAREI